MAVMLLPQLPAPLAVLTPQGKPGNDATATLVLRPIPNNRSGDETMLPRAQAHVHAKCGVVNRRSHRLRDLCHVNST